MAYDTSLTAARGRILNVALALAAALGTALAMQALLGIQPCHMCLVEREPYYAAIPLAAALAAYPRRLPTLAIKLGMVVLAGLLCWSLALGVQHVGVERGWWPGPVTCTSGGDALPDPRTLVQQLRNLSVVACDKVQVRVVGLSLAEWNALLSGVLTLVVLDALRRLRSDRRAAAQVAISHTTTSGAA